MSAPTLILADPLISELRLLCACPSSATQPQDLGVAAELVAAQIRAAGLDTRLVGGAGAPVVLARRSGRHPYTLLLYHHYDVAPPGPWRVWSHEPFQLAEREEMLYGRGVAHGKGPLVAHLQALRALLQSEGELPCGVALVVEGAGLSGSYGLEEVLTRHRDFLAADACLASAGERDDVGAPFCYSGSKGMLQIRLTAQGAAAPLPAGMAATVPNPLWRLAWALASIKGEDEEVRIHGFYDAIAGPSRSENALLRKVRLGENRRLEAWQMPEFLFGMAGAALTQAEVTLPTCNLMALSAEPASDLPAIPALAQAQLDFQLVPHQVPEEIAHLLREHLIGRGFADVQVQPLPGGYAAVNGDPELPFIQGLAQAVAAVYARAPQRLPLGPFAQPLALFARHLGTPVAAVGLARPYSAVRGPDERLPLADLVQHGQVLIELLAACGAGA